MHLPSTFRRGEDHAVIGVELETDAVAFAQTRSVAVGLDHQEATFGAFEDVMDFGTQIDDVDHLAGEHVLAGLFGPGFGARQI